MGREYSAGTSKAPVMFAPPLFSFDCEAMTP
nr:MAG TPA: hypothetical protein [Caudoviricetes sp.]DAP50837.1 MAG TPA: hypothetical protein [Caudoviricetes sp.]DAP77429.1 MAG TPA: hypothetical protein [Caudoviricetes sp.]